MGLAGIKLAHLKGERRKRQMDLEDADKTFDAALVGTLRKSMALDRARLDDGELPFAA